MANQNAQMKSEFIIYNFLDDSGVSDGSFWERIKSLDAQGVIVNKPISSFFLSKFLHEPTDNNSNTINTTPTVSLPSNTNYNRKESVPWNSFLTRNFKTLRKYLRLNPIVRE